MLEGLDNIKTVCCGENNRTGLRESIKVNRVRRECVKDYRTAEDGRVKSRQRRRGR